jgi:hypothetical protein
MGDGGGARRRAPNRLLLLVVAHAAACCLFRLSARYLDPAAAQFVGGFLTLDRAALLAAVGAASPAAAASLGGITAAQWPVLQGYLASLVPSWGSLVFSGWLAAGGGGLITTKSVETWMNGAQQTDPIAPGCVRARGSPHDQHAQWS